MKRILIDTDVILDFFFDRQPFSKDAALLLSLCENKQIEGYITPVIISNTCYLLRRIAKHEKVIEKLKLLVKITSVLDMNSQVVENALHSNFLDFEDALQNFSAQNKGTIDVIITRNVKDYKKSELGVFTPHNYLKLIDA
ncbi:MAG: PIN domain-containing protein [Bacteroidales bacterium]|nr:PIN domain-containing protein [Bacteroidales bacterium]